MRRGCTISAIAVGIVLILAFVSIGMIGGRLQRPMSARDSVPNPSRPGPRADPNEVIYCEVLQDQTTRAQCDYYQEIWDKLEVGAGGVVIPDSLVRGDTATISFAITRDPNDAPLPELLGQQPDQEVKLRIGQLMAAELQGDGFKIEPGGLQQRDLFVGNSTRWDWKVTPLKARTYQLMLSAYVVVRAADEAQKESLLKTLDLPLSVTVTWGQRLGDAMDDSQAWLAKGTNWIKALTAFLLAVGALIAIFRRKKPGAQTP